MAAKTIDYGWEADVPDSDNYIAPGVLGALAEVGARTVMDAGCGNGALAIRLQREGYRVCAMDGDARGIALASQAGPEIDFRQMTFDQNPAAFPLVAANGLDAVVSTEVVEHLYAPHEFVTFAHAALKPGGYLIVTTPYHGFLKNLALSLFNKWDRHLTPLWHGGHIKFWSRDTLSTLITKEPFEIVGFRGLGRYPYLWKSMMLIARKTA